MLRIPCPKCRKNVYSPDVDSFCSCPYCGSKFSGKYGPDKRSESRTLKEIPFQISYQGQNFEASTYDFSEKGVGIKILGKVPIGKGDVLNLQLGNPSIVGKVVWINKTSDQALAGLQRLE